MKVILHILLLVALVGVVSSFLNGDDDIDKDDSLFNANDPITDADIDDAAEIVEEEPVVETQEIQNSLPDVQDQIQKAVNAALGNVQTRLQNMQDEFVSLAKQVMLQQFYTEERVRGLGQSGIVNTRLTSFGPHNYNGASHVSSRNIMAMHAHTNHIRTAGLGEFIANMNGVLFRTRHNDYKLVQPSTTSRKYGATEPIPFPPVPPAVLANKDVQGQMDEMVEYYKAWASQNVTHRDYRPYFKPILCYLEGAWTLDKDIVEPFSSDRHHLDASSWQDLQNKVRYGAYTGVKSPGENYANLPTTIMYVNSKTGQPMYAQWNYRVVCSPIKRDIPFKWFHQQLDMKISYPKDDVENPSPFSNSARFTLDDNPTATKYRSNILDKIFYDITGKDNFPSKLKQDAYNEILQVPGTKQNIDTSRYHRSATLGKKDAMGNKFMMRGFNDVHMWAAQTTQKRVAPMITENCKKVKVKVGKKWTKKEVCKHHETRFSWAFPIEIIYLTPAHRWNPYNITYTAKKNFAGKGGNHGRKEKKALNGADLEKYYRTPVEFLSGETLPEDPADTEVKGGLWVKCNDGVVRKCGASGIKTMVNVPTVGKTRIRWPIPPIASENSGVWQELTAFRDWVLEKEGAREAKSKIVEFTMSTSEMDPPGRHTHTFELSEYDIQQMKEKKESRVVKTSYDQGHVHELRVVYRDGAFKYVECAGKRERCWDDHRPEVFPTSEVDSNSV